MKKNMGGLDRAIRALVGLSLIAIVFVGPQTPFGWFGLFPLVSGLLGRCPAYLLFGVKTCRVNPDEAKTARSAGHSPGARG